MGWIGPPAADAVPDLIDVLSDKDADVRRCAAFALGKIGDGEQVIPELITLLNDADAGVRRYAAAAIGWLARDFDGAATAIAAEEGKDKTAVGTIKHRVHAAVAARLKDDDADVRRCAAFAVAALGVWDGTSAQRLATALSSAEPEVRRYAAAAVQGSAWSHTELVAPLLVKLLEDESLVVRRAAAFSLGYAAGAIDRSVQKNADTRQQIAKGLIRALGDADSQLRRSALAALAPCILSNDADWAAITKLTEHPDAETRAAAVLALADADDAGVRSRSITLKAFRDPDARVRRAAVMGVDVGPTIDGGRAALVKALDDDAPCVRIRAALAFALGSFTGGADRARALGSVLQARADPNPDVRRQAVIALDDLGVKNPHADAALIKALSDPAPEVRSRAAVAFQCNLEHRADATKAIPALILAARDDYPAVRRNALAALSCIGEPAKSAGPQIIDALASDPDPQVRIRAVLALRTIRPDPAKAVPALAKAMADKNGTVGWSAFTAMAWFGKDAELAVPVLVEMIKSDEGIRQFCQEAAGESEVANPAVASQTPAVMREVVKAALRKAAGL